MNRRQFIKRITGALAGFTFFGRPVWSENAREIDAAKQALNDCQPEFHMVTDECEPFTPEDWQTVKAWREGEL